LYNSEKMIRLVAGWDELSTVQKIAASALFAATVFEIIAWAVFPFTGYDSFSHIFWIGEWHRMWQAGIFYPRWLPDSFHGFGAPSFYYYPPFTYALASILYLVLPGMSPDGIGKVLGLLAFAFSGMSMCVYLRWRSMKIGENQLGRVGIILGSLLYTFAPYRIFNYATRGALPEHIALGFVPFVFFGADLVMRRRRSNDTLLGMAIVIAAFSLLIITNLPAAAATGIGIFIYVLAHERGSRSRGMSMLSLCSIAALLLTAYYLFPVAAMFGDVQLGRLWRPVPVVLSSPFLAIFTGQAITINSYTFVSLVGACILFAGFIRQRSTANPMFWLLALIIVVQLPFIAKYLFVYVPPFSIVQLSYRMSILLLIVVAIAWQNELTGNEERNDNAKSVHLASNVVAFWSVCTIVLVGLQLADVHVHKHGPLPVGEAPEYATRWARPYYEWGAMLNTSFANDTQNIVWPSDEKVSVISSIRKPYSDTIDYESKADGHALIRRSYWPEWKASIDGSASATAPDSLGRLTIGTPAGNHKLVVWLENLKAAKVGAWVSSISLLILVILWIFASRIGRARFQSEQSSA
jgi:hypothetical protein